MTTKMIDEYFNFYDHYTKEFGENICVLYACGTFYECYEIDNEKEKIGNACKVANINNLLFSNKNKEKRLKEGSSRAYPDFCGFKTSNINKYLSKLLEFGFTVIVVDQIQDENQKKGDLIKREVTAIHSPCLCNPDNINNSNTLVNLFIEIIKTPVKGFTLIYSIVSFNNLNNSIEITENSFEININKINLQLDDLGLTRYDITQLIVYITGKLNLTDSIKNFFNENGFNYKVYTLDSNDKIYQNYIKVDYQNQFFKKVYKHFNFGLLSSIEFLGLEMYPLSIINFMYLIDFIGKYDTKYILNLNKPIIFEESNNLLLQLNTIDQLNILPKKENISSVFDIINFTSTILGKRALQQLLIKPFKDHKTIEYRYTLTEELSKLHHKKIDNCLKGIVDLDKYHRKMGLKLLFPYELSLLDNSYILILDIIDNLNDTFEIPNLYSFYEYRNDYKKTFDFDKLNDTNYFNKGQIIELDLLQESIDLVNDKMEKIRLYYDKKINIKNSNPFVKLVYTDIDLYHLTLTKTRYKTLITTLKESEISDITKKDTISLTKIYTKELIKLGNELSELNKIMTIKIKDYYIKKIEEYYIKYNDVFNDFKIFVELVDITLSNLKCSMKYNYTKPVITDKGVGSFIEIKSIRHPIVERINNIEFIPNDIVLDENNFGILLYGLNSSGKSICLKSIGIAIILAQIGYYVPCKELNFYPFDTILSQVDLTDNLFKNRSSFMNEVYGIKKIIETTGPNNLVLCDEPTNGTEFYSSMAIVQTLIHRLIETKTKFIFTSHLHEMKMENTEKLQVKHISVKIDNDKIIFERKLKDGSGDSIYGLEVLKSVINDEKFMDSSFKLRNKLIDNKIELLSTNRSRYNKKKIMDNCEICGRKNNLETHHINEQKNCDSNGFVNDKHFHKNEIYNLVCLCNECHKKVTYNKIITNGYIVTTQGIFLDYHEK